MCYLKSITIVILFLSFWGCSDKSKDIIGGDDIEIDSLPGLYAPVKFHSLYLPSLNKYGILGCGYDGSYSDFNGINRVYIPIIDLERFASGAGRDQITGESVHFPFISIDESILHSGDEISNWGNDLKDYEASLNTNYNISNTIKGEKQDLFMGETVDMVSDTCKFSSIYSFYRINKKIYTRRLMFSDTRPEVLRFFLTDDFLHDLDALSANQLVFKYGTHVLTDVLLGGNGCFLFSGELNSTEDRIQFQEQSKKCMKLIQANDQISNNQLDFNLFKDVEVTIKTVGGTNSITKNYSNNTSLDIEDFRFGFNEWQSSIVLASEQLVGIGNATTHIYWLSDFVDDVQKKNDIEEAIIMYIKERSLKMKERNKLSYSTHNIGYELSYSKYFLLLNSNKVLEVRTQSNVEDVDIENAKWIFLPLGNYYRLQVSRKGHNYYLSDQGVSEYEENSTGLLWKIQSEVGDSIVVLMNMKNGMCLTHSLSFISYCKNDNTLLWNINK